MIARSVVILPILLWATLAPAADALPLNPARVREISEMLPESPGGLAPAITDRAAWEKLGQLPAYQKLLADADKFLKDPIPDQPDELFLLYTKTGDRDKWQSVAFDRRKRFQVLVLAECLRNDGRYLGKIGEYLTALCGENTWMYPAHDSTLANFKKTAVDVDLGSSTLGWNIATAVAMLGDRLDGKVRELAMENLNRRIITPFNERITGKKALWWWQISEMNWNSVCLAGCVGTALAVGDRPTRARFVAAAEVYGPLFLKGFTADGYCTEGLGYWNYGFGRFVMLSETIRRGTGGKINLLEHAGAQLPAQFAERIEIAHGIYPAFADCQVSARPDRFLTGFLGPAFGYPAVAPAGTADVAFTDLATEAIYRMPPAQPVIPVRTAITNSSLRTFFDKTGILIARPEKTSAAMLSVALKGGSNHEEHNHNDVGSYVVVMGTNATNARAMILDPGPERYTSRTFSSKRYESKLLSSYGHSVPIVAGELQHEGKETDARVVKADFGNLTDTLSLDITKAYSVKSLSSLTRTWVYSREGAGSLSVADAAVFSSPQSFATTLITNSPWKKLPDGRLEIHDGPHTLSVVISASGDYTVSSEVIEENAAIKPTRLVIALKDPAGKPTITLRIVPTPTP